MTTSTTNPAHFTGWPLEALHRAHASTLYWLHDGLQSDPSDEDYPANGSRPSLEVTVGELRAIEFVLQGRAR